jgi:hypothetical protein
MNLPSQLQAFVSGFLEGGIGQLLTVTHPATEQGMDGAIESVYFLPQPVSGQGVAMMLEAGYNVGEADRHDFVCAGGSNVGEDDLIGTFKGRSWKVVLSDGSPLGGTEPVLHCYAVRQ